jgi:3-oxoacyl-[acyl-carrier protein] reductase
LAGRVAVVTGSSGGIGRAIAVELADAGADVVVHCRGNIRGAAETAEAVRRRGVRSAVVAADLSDPAERDVLVDQAVGLMGGRLDIWVNNAGVDILTGEGPKWPFAEKLRRLLAVDVEATLLLSRAAAERMPRSPGPDGTRAGVILNIGWDQAETGFPGDSGELFAAVKGAVMCLSRSLALSLAPRVRVNCIAPGWIRTAWGEGASDPWQKRVLRETPLKRWGLPEDVAKVARFLAGPSAAFLTGQTVAVNGGAVR